MATETLGRSPGLPRSATLEVLIDFCNRLLLGKLNAVLQMSLTANAATSTVTDSRIGPLTAILFSPLTAHAAAEIPMLYVSAQIKGVATLTHTNNAQTDRTFNVAFIG